MASTPAKREDRMEKSPSPICLGRLKRGEGSPSDIEAANASLRGVLDDDHGGEWLALRVETLRAHFFRPEDDQRLRDAVRNEWMQILHGLPRWALERACRDYLANHGRKEPPAPGDIAKLARGYVAEVRFALDRQHQAEMDRRSRPAPPTPEAKARMQAAVDGLLEQVNRGARD